MSVHGHADSEPCGLNCPVGGADGTTHQATIEGITLCTNEPFTNEEVAALREYFALLEAKSAAQLDGGDAHNQQEARD